jgi:hypothetical protein
LRTFNVLCIKGMLIVFTRMLNNLILFLHFFQLCFKRVFVTLWPIVRYWVSLNIGVHSSLYVWCNDESLIQTICHSSLLTASFGSKHVYNLHVFLNGALNAGLFSISILLIICMYIFGVEHMYNLHVFVNVKLHANLVSSFCSRLALNTFS